MVAVPAATQQLASYGASVIKVEDTVTGDGMRFYGSNKNGMSGWFANTNAGKRSIALDLKSEQGKDILWRLLDDADVLIEGFRAGVMGRLGFGYQAVSARNPGIIYCASSGFGPEGPYAQRPVFDPLIQALSGWAGSQQVDGRPTLVRGIVADKVGAWNNAQAIMAALYRKSRTGEGANIQTNMLDANLAFVWPDAMMHCSLTDAEGVNHTPNIMQTYRLFQCRDGWITMAIGTDPQWQAACRALEREDLIEDPRLTTALDRNEHVEYWYEMQDAMTAPFTVAEATGRLIAADVPTAPVLLPDDVFDDAQVQATGLILESEHPVLGGLRGPRPRATVMDVELALSPAPSWGQHTEEILSELGFDEEALSTLASSAAIKLG